MTYTTLSNGDLMFHRHGNPPPDLKNYTRDANNPYLLHPNFPDCPKLEYKNKLTACKKLYGVWWCNEFDRGTAPPECNACPVREQLCQELTKTQSEESRAQS